LSSKPSSKLSYYVDDARLLHVGDVLRPCQNERRLENGQRGVYAKLCKDQEGGFYYLQLWKLPEDEPDERFGDRFYSWSHFGQAIPELKSGSRIFGGVKIKPTFTYCSIYRKDEIGRYQELDTLDRMIKKRKSSLEPPLTAPLALDAVSTPPQIEDLAESKTPMRVEAILSGFAHNVDDVAALAALALPSVEESVRQALVGWKRKEKEVSDKQEVLKKQRLEYDRLAQETERRLASAQSELDQAQKQIKDAELILQHAQLAPGQAIAQTPR